MQAEETSATSLGTRPTHHGRDVFFIEGEGFVGRSEGTFDQESEKAPSARRTAAVAEAEAAEVPPFRFSRLGPVGQRLDRDSRVKVARAMTADDRGDGVIPAGFTYLGQFVDHDLTFDATTVALGDNVSPADLLQGRSPTLDLDSLYGAGPGDPVSARFYDDDGRHLKKGTTTEVGTDVARVGFDVPRVGTSTSPRKANIPDLRNDENLAVAQHHAAFIRFHNRVVNTLPNSVPVSDRFRKARQLVVLHYQWMLRTDYLTRICDKEVVEDVFRHGRKVFEVGADPFSMPTMPVEFSVAAFRLGHSMVRDAYDWNARFPDNQGSLDLLFTFSRTSGNLGGNPTLPSNWIADFRRLYRFSEIDHDELKPPAPVNNAKRIDTKLVDPLARLRAGSFGGTQSQEGTIDANLAFRNLTRATMVKLGSGQQLADLLIGKGVAVTKLTRAQIRDGAGGVGLGSLTDAERDEFLTHTPLWFYILREAELNNGRLAGVGARIVAETFNRAIEGSSFSIVRNKDFRPTLGEVDGRFRMADLLFFAFEGKKGQLAPLGD
jgi:hypothetical protein